MLKTIILLEAGLPIILCSQAGAWEQVMELGAEVYYKEIPLRNLAEFEALF